MTEQDQELWDRCASDMTYFIDNFITASFSSPSHVTIPLPSNDDLSRVISRHTHTIFETNGSYMADNSYVLMGCAIWHAMFNPKRRVLFAADWLTAAKYYKTTIVQLIDYLPEFMRSRVATNRKDTSTIYFDQHSSITVSCHQEYGVSNKMCHVLLVNDTGGTFFTLHGYLSGMKKISEIPHVIAFHNKAFMRDELKEHARKFFMIAKQPPSLKLPFDDNRVFFTR